MSGIPRTRVWFGFLFLASVVLCVLLANDTARAQQEQGFRLSAPFGITEPRVHLRADRGLSLGLSNLVAAWRGTDARYLSLVQTDGAKRPHYRRYAMNGEASLDFDADDVLQRLDGMPSGDYTIVVVVRLDDLQGVNTILGSPGGGPDLFFDGSDVVELDHGGTSIVSSISLSPGQVGIVSATYSVMSGIAALYVDGTPAASGSLGLHGGVGIEVGSLDGGIAELLIFDRVLPSAERSSVESDLSVRYQSSFPQVQFDEQPQDAQVFPRDESDLAFVELEGEVLDAGFDTIVAELFKDGQSDQTVSEALTYEDGRASFDLELVLDAGLIDYEVRVRLEASGQPTPIAVYEHLACGDIYLLQGQSNAQAGDQHDEGLGNTHQSIWIRSFGTAAVDESVSHDLHWDIAEGNRFNQHASVGALGLRLADLLIADFQVPIAMLNGAVPGTSILFHERFDGDPDDLVTIYGRLLFRAQQAGVAAAARAMIWYQGEADGDNTALYETKFGELRDDWNEDYSGLEQIYVVQIRKGCGVADVGVREVQRLFGDVYPDVTVMSSTAAPQHDGCHYFFAGYEELGERIMRVVARDLYGSSDNHEIDPPNILSAAYVDGDQDEVLLTFRDPDDSLFFEAGAEEDVVLNDPSVTVVGGVPSGNTILLTLSGSSTATTISYVGHFFDGPWILNGRGVGALTFFSIPIDPAP